MINPWRPYRPETCSGKRWMPSAIMARRDAPFWQRIKRRLLKRKAAQKAARHAK